MDNIAENWPPFKGDYIIGDPESCIAVVTLASSIETCDEAAIWGTCKTENLGVEKVVTNVISNSNIRYILLCGGESRGHLSGKSLISLHENGIDNNGRIIGSEGAIPFIENIPESAIKRFQEQVDIVDMTGITDTEKIHRLVHEYYRKNGPYEENPYILQKNNKKPAKTIKAGSSADIIISEEFGIDSVTGSIFKINV
ncbi:tetrahydromethanopterin S-methyltransferase subunit A [Methanosalsum natronophilum]|uniref:Tetrahydromethanopterin S-methyltransferase subunit A n=1 Tax=Methanosalsum natronophilum TaxID=768733 RepID=A0A3R7XQ91_9EURY|nr:tetrahydromethanopterin S-methyltransferase subunit A [Methanosalsum natronophilum]MCS3923281.1 tetrahydromethanopterin S-methyltransferase subunit A [Methanosalsum natronophilum]RQD80958.1 MAG: tetrahydromethanopterin S-methyltransferase subunit A [Methanosalsum natronophilum]